MSGQIAPSSGRRLLALCHRQPLGHGLNMNELAPRRQPPGVVCRLQEVSLRTSNESSPYAEEPAAAALVDSTPSRRSNPVRAAVPPV